MCLQLETHTAELHGRTFALYFRDVFAAIGDDLEGNPQGLKLLPINLCSELFALLSPPDFFSTQSIDECGGRLHLLPTHVRIVEQILHLEMRNGSDNISKHLSRGVLCSHIKPHEGISQFAK